MHTKLACTFAALLALQTRPDNVKRVAWLLCQRILLLMASQATWAQAQRHDWVKPCLQLLGQVFAAMHSCTAQQLGSGLDSLKRLAALDIVHVQQQSSLWLRLLWNVLLIQEQVRTETRAGWLQCLWHIRCRMHPGLDYLTEHHAAAWELELSPRLQIFCRTWTVVQQSKSWEPCRPRR